MKGLKGLKREKVDEKIAFDRQKTYFSENSQWHDTPIYRLMDLKPGVEVKGPA